MNLERARAAQAASHMIQSGLLGFFIKEMTEVATAELVATQTNDREKREECYLRLKALEQLEMMCKNLVAEARSEAEAKRA